MTSGIKQDERGRYYYTFPGPNGWPLMRYCQPPIRLRVVLDPIDAALPRAWEQRIHLERYNGSQWVTVV